MIRLKIPGKKTGTFQSSFAKGLAGETKASRDYERRGFKVLGRRVKTPVGEIDLIVAAPEGNQIVFVEVKQRRSLTEASYAITPAQQQRLLRAADTWIGGRAEFTGYRLRFDAMLYDGDGNLKLIENAFGLS